MILYSWLLGSAGPSCLNEVGKSWLNPPCESSRGSAHSTHVSTSLTLIFSILISMGYAIELHSVLARFFSLSLYFLLAPIITYVPLELTLVFHGN